MNINIQNNIPNVDVTLNKSADGSVSILLTEKKVLTLGDIKCGGITKSSMSWAMAQKRRLCLSRIL